MTRTVGEVIAAALKQYDVPFAAGIPGHGNWALIDAFSNTETAPRFVQVMHEQSAAHMADACFRLTGQPGAAIASIGPGATNLLMGLATAYSDSSAFVAIAGAASTTMRGHGVMQTLDRKYLSDFGRLSEPASKATFEINHPDVASSVLHRAFNTMTTGRPGPVAIDVPMDVQVAETSNEIASLEHRRPMGRIRADNEGIERAVELLLSAERPCIVAGGGVMTSAASPELVALAEKLNIPVVYTWNGKGGFPDDHVLCAGPVGVGGSRAANRIAANASVILAVGCRFSDWGSSSFRKGVSYSIPPTKLIHVDIDPGSIGRTYPVEVGLISDIKVALADMSDAVSAQQAQATTTRRQSYIEDIHRSLAKWQQVLDRRLSTTFPTNMISTLHALRKVMPRHAVVTVGSGHCQAAVRQGFPVFEPRTHITSGGYSSMGFAVPAAIASKIVQPDVPVVAIVGDGDMLMSIHELATAVMQNLSVVFLVLNNSGFMSIRDGQNALFERNIASEFAVAGSGAGLSYSPDFISLARSFGLEFAERAEQPCDVGVLVRKALDCGGPALVEIPITKDETVAGAEPSGWWDFPPSPSARNEIWQDYRHGVEAQQHLNQTTDDVELHEPLGIYG